MLHSEHGEADDCRILRQHSAEVPHPKADCARAVQWAHSRLSRIPSVPNSLVPNSLVPNSLIGDIEADQRVRFTAREQIRKDWNDRSSVQVGLPSNQVGYFVDKSPPYTTTYYPECTFSSGTGSPWWDNVNGRSATGGTEFRSWLSGGILNAYIGGPFFLKILYDGVKTPNIPPVWVVTQTFPHAGNLNFSKVGAVCAHVKSARN